MVRLQETRDRFSVTIPKSLVRAVKWAKGTEIVFSINQKGNLELVKV